MAQTFDVRLGANNSTEYNFPTDSMLTSDATLTIGSSHGPNLTTSDGIISLQTLNTDQLSPVPIDMSSLGTHGFGMVCNNGAAYISPIRDNALMSFSRDGATWSLFPLASPCRVWTKPIWTGSLFVLVGNAQRPGYGVTSRVFTSPDGIVWTENAMPSAQSWTSVVWTGSQLLAVSDGQGAGSSSAAVSPDGITWTPYTMPQMSTGSGAMDAPWGYLAYGNGTIVATIENDPSTGLNTPTYAYSTDNATTWTFNTFLTSGLGSQAQFYQGIVEYSNGQFIMVASGFSDGHGGEIPSNLYQTSPDGITWTASSLPYSDTWTNACHQGDKLWIVGASHTMLGSSDFVTWDGLLVLQTNPRIGSDGNKIVSLSSTANSAIYEYVAPPATPHAPYNVGPYTGDNQVATTAWVAQQFASYSLYNSYVTTGTILASSGEIPTPLQIGPVGSVLTSSEAGMPVWSSPLGAQKAVVNLDDGFSYTAMDSNQQPLWTLILVPNSSFTNGTVTIDDGGAKPDGQLLTIVATAGIASFTLASTGGSTFQNPPTSLTASVMIQMMWDQTTLTWYRLI